MLTQRTWCKSKKIHNSNSAAQVVTWHICQRCVGAFWVIFNHISCLNLLYILSFPTLYPSLLLMSSLCLWFIYSMWGWICLFCTSVPLPEIKWSLSWLGFVGVIWRGPSSSAAPVKGFILVVTDADDLNNVEIPYTCVFVPAAASFSSSCWLLFTLLPLSDSSPSALSCKQGGKQSLRACWDWATAPERDQVIFHTHLNTKLMKCAQPCSCS